MSQIKNNEKLFHDQEVTTYFVKTGIYKYLKGYGDCRIYHNKDTNTLEVSHVKLTENHIISIYLILKEEGVNFYHKGDTIYIEIKKEFLDKIKKEEFVYTLDEITECRNILNEELSDPSTFDFLKTENLLEDDDMISERDKRAIMRQFK